MTTAKLTTATPAKLAKTKAPAKVITEIILSLKAVRAARAFSAAKTAEAKAIERKKRAEAILRDALGDADQGVYVTPEGVRLVLVKVMHSSNSKFDSDILKTRFPDAYDAAKVTTAYTYLKTT